MPITRFDSVRLVNLDRRPDRLDSFTKGFQAAGWPFQEPERFAAIDGLLSAKPIGYSQQPGAWACLQGHLTLWQEAVEKKQNVFIFEDDAVFHKDFASLCPRFMADVPNDWDMIYLGGLHRYSKMDQAKKVSEHCWIPWGVTGTWAYAVSAKFAPVILRWFSERSMYETTHIDQMLCLYQVLFRPKVYIPHPWLCGMAEGESDICGRVYMGNAWWDWTPDSQPKPYIAMDLLGRSVVEKGVQIGDGAFRFGFEPYWAKTFKRIN